MLNLYIDETCQNNHHYMAIGGISVLTDDAPIVTAHFNNLKTSINLSSELKWTKVSKAKLYQYKMIVDEYFKLAEKNRVKFHAIIIDLTKVNHTVFNAGDSETGFSKFIYQLLVSSIGRKFANDHDFNVYLDYRTIKNSEARLTELKNVMNNGISRRFDIHSAPYKRVEFRRSKATTLLQITDIILGATGFHKNEKHLRSDASEAKIDLANHISAHTGYRPLGLSTPRCECNYNIWNFDLK